VIKELTQRPEHASVAVSPAGEDEVYRVLQRRPILPFHLYVVSYYGNGGSSPDGFDFCAHLGRNPLELAPALAQYFYSLGIHNHASAAIPLVREFINNGVRASGTRMTQISFLVFKYLRDSLHDETAGTDIHDFLTDIDDTELHSFVKDRAKSVNVFQNILDESYT